MKQEEIILSQSEYESLLNEVHRLQARISELTALRDDLIYHICPALQAEYEEKIASLEREVLAAEMYLRENQRTLEILQAQMNRQKKLDVDEAQKQAKEEFKEYEEDLKQKAKEAEEFKEKWEKESQWSEHDRREKEEKKNQEEKKQQEKKQQEQSDSPVEKLKRLYRKIVKRLHPDVHPNPTMREKELLNLAQEAMKRGDLEAMQRIYDELCGMDAPEEQFEDTPEGIASLKELIRKLEERLKALQKEIRHIRSEFPYTMKSFLEDEQAVEERRQELKEKLRNLREANEKLVEFIRKIRKETGL